MENVYIYEVCHNNGIESLYTRPKGGANCIV